MDCAPLQCVTLHVKEPSSKKRKKKGDKKERRVDD